MKIKGKIMWEIIFICLGAAVTLGLSINSVIQNGKKDIEIEQKTDSLLEAQQTINNKSEKIIQLQNELQEKAEIQIKNLLRLNNPIPKKIQITLFTTIETTEEELVFLSTASKINGNMLPIANKASIERVDRFKNAQIILKLTFKKGNKSMNIIFSQTPIQFVGFNSVQLSGTFTLATAQNELQFSGIKLQTENIETNYSSTSLLDFNGCDVVLEINFGFAQRWLVGTKEADLYGIGSDPGVDINLKNINLTTEGRELIIRDMRKIGKNKFKGKWNGE